MGRERQAALAWRIGPIQAEEIPEVVALEERCGLSSWGTDGYRQQLCNPDSVILVARWGERGSQPLLFGLISGWVVVDEFQIHTLAVAPERRREGIGGALLKAGMRLADSRGANRAVLEVRSRADAAHRLYWKYGFRYVGERKGYYQAPPDDAWVMVCDGQAWARSARCVCGLNPGLLYTTISATDQSRY